MRLHWSGDWPEYLRALLTALQELDEVERAPEGTVVLCPDATALAPPAGAGEALVAVVPRGEALLGDDPAATVAGLRPWAARDAVFVVSTPTAAGVLAAGLGLAPERVHTVVLPLAPERVPPAGAEGGRDVLAVGPIAYPALLTAIGMLRIAGSEPRCLLAAADAAALAHPGCTAGRFGLFGGTETVAIDDWLAAVDDAGAILLSEAMPDTATTLRQALATGRPVVAPATTLVLDHLTALGARAYLYPDSADVLGLTRALAAALRRDRGAGLERRAREAVLGEQLEAAARGLYSALEQALAPPRAPVVRLVARPTAPGLRVCVINPRGSGGGGERFMRELVGAMARHASRPRVTLVCATETEGAFDAGAGELERAGVEVRTALAADFAVAAAPAMANADVVYCSWPHLTDPPVTDAPLVCTFHDVNWRHFDVMGAPEKALVERQSPVWLDRCAAVVHSSQFIRDEVHHHYGAPPQRTHVIPLTAQAPERPATAAERAQVRSRYALPERFLLSPAGYHLHKNYAGLDAALRRLRAAGRPVTVIATGALTDVHFHGPDLIGLGYVGARELLALYAESAGVVQATLYEAGSFPMAEAMIAEQPVAISRIAPVVEQVQRVGVVAELFHPADPDDMATAIARLWDGDSPAADPATVARNAGRVAARTWDHVAGEYLELLAAVAVASVAPLSADARAARPGP